MALRSKRTRRKQRRTRKRNTRRKQRGGNIGARGIPSDAVLANPMPLDSSEGGIDVE
jgi:hypothetical protein